MRKTLVADWVALLGVVALVCLGLAVTSPAFLTEFNLYVLGRDLSITLIIALGQLVVLALGNMNLSIGSIGGLVAVLTGGMMEVWGWPIWLAVLVGLLLGTLAGVFNGLLTAWTGINSLIVTLATTSIFLGINLGLTSAKPFYKLPAEFKAFGAGRAGPFPYIGIVTLVVAILMLILFRRIVLGRQILAMGGNAKAAELSGIPVARVMVATQAISGALAAVAGILLMARLGSAQPTIGEDWVLPSFAAPIIGGVALTGGSISVVGTALAALLVALIQNGLVLLNIDPFWVQFLLGCLILGAVGLKYWTGQLKMPVAFRRKVA
jgi:ribose transport system permease protein